MTQRSEQVGATRTNTTRDVIGIASLFITAGVLHHVIPAWFDRIVPAWIPDARAATLWSGAAEIVGGIGILIPATRRYAGVGLIALLIAVFPANINMLQMAHASADSSTAYLVALWIRLPLQLLMIWWVWRVAVTRPPRPNT